jgi:hypothetical protein
MNYQGNMFGKPVPVFEDCAAWLKEEAIRIWWLYDGGNDQEIADDDAYMQVRYWDEYEGLGQILGKEGLKKFMFWYCEHNPTSSETLTRARRYLTNSDQPNMVTSPEVKKRREHKQRMIQSQMAEA